MFPHIQLHLVPLHNYWQAAKRCLNNGLTSTVMANIAHNQLFLFEGLGEQTLSAQHCEFLPFTVITFCVFCDVKREGQSMKLPSDKSFSLTCLHIRERSYTELETN